MILGAIGGIGSGKSTVASFIAENYGAVLLRTDDIAKELMKSPALIKRLKEAFPKGIVKEDGSLDKELYAKLIYGDESLLKLSNSIVHPAVWDYVKEATKEGLGLYVVETALPDEHFLELCDFIIAVERDDELRIEDLVKERGHSPEYFSKIIKNQRSKEGYAKLSDYVISNSGSVEGLKRKAAEILDDICKLG